MHTTDLHSTKNYCNTTQWCYVTGVTFCSVLYSDQPAQWRRWD